MRTLLFQDLEVESRNYHSYDKNLLLSKLNLNNDSVNYFPQSEFNELIKSIMKSLENYEKNQNIPWILNEMVD